MQTHTLCMCSHADTVIQKRSKWELGDGSGEKLLLCRYKELSSNPQHSNRRHAQWHRSVTPGYGREQRKMDLRSGQLASLSKTVCLWFRERPCLKK